MSDRMETSGKAAGVVGTCPICGVEVLETNQYRPFCSERCRTIDLGRWLDEGYRVSRPIEQADLERSD
ncbi:MAG: DNA gyrase inhibitor YacG [Planctomycetota bacterium]